MVVNMTVYRLSSTECVTWTVLLIIECVAIVTLNFLTIVVFINNRGLRKRSTYLLINLAVSDMLIGAVTGTNDVYELGVRCDFWYYKVERPVTTSPVIYGIYAFSPAASLVNITIISLERLHATFYPLKHLVAEKKVYIVVISTSWVVVSATVSGAVVSGKVRILHMCAPIFLSVIIISYISIFIKIRFGAQPQHHGAADREKRLTVTLFIVTALSLLMWLPFIIRRLMQDTEIYESLSYSMDLRIYNFVNMLFFGNSLVNPVLYAIRMPDFKKALVALFCKPKLSRVIPNIPLNDM